MGFFATLRLAVALVCVLLTIGFGLGAAYHLWQFAMFQDVWFLSLALSYGLFTALSGGVGWLAHPD